MAICSGSWETVNALLKYIPKEQATAEASNGKASSLDATSNSPFLKFIIHVAAEDADILRAILDAGGDDLISLRCGSGV